MYRRRLSEISRPAKRSRSTRSFSKGNSSGNASMGTLTPPGYAAWRDHRRAKRIGPMPTLARHITGDRFGLERPCPYVLTADTFESYPRGCGVDVTPRIVPYLPSELSVVRETGNILRSANVAISNWNISHCSLQLWYSVVKSTRCFPRLSARLAIFRSVSNASSTHRRVLASQRYNLLISYVGVRLRWIKTSRFAQYPVKRTE